ncbi:endodeoxyribonuclease [Rhodotorula sphaerocarpa]
MSLDPQIDSMSLDELADFEPSPAEPSRPFTGPRPSRSSTCFSALTMTSSDDAFVEDEADPSSGWAELDSMELDEEEEDQSDSALVVDDGPAEDDDSLPELAFSSDEDTTSPESASPEWPRRTSIGEAINSDEELLLFADLGPDEDTLGGEFGESIWANDSFKQSTASYAAEEERPGAKETGPPMLDIDGVGATEERTPAPPAASSLRWRQLEADSLSGLNACKTRSDTGGDNEAVSEPPPAKVDTPGSPTQAQMDAFFGFVPKTSSVQAPPTSEPPRARQQIEAKTASPPPVQPSARRTQAIKFPRKYGQGKDIRMGCRELAAFIRVVQLLLEGLASSTVSTKRDLFYRDVSLFRKQAVVDSLIDDITATLRVRRSDLGVAATAKGLFTGAVKLVLKDGSEIEGSGKASLIPAGQAIAWVIVEEIKWILIVEKDAIFTTLTEAKMAGDADLGNGILLTGKGYPDVATRELLKRFSDIMPAVPVLGIVDCDPHGLDILATYRLGSAAHAHDVGNLACGRVEWAGLKLADIVSGDGRREKLLPLKPSDRLKAHTMLKMEELPPTWRRELEQMLRLGYKAETEILAERPASGDGADHPQPPAPVKYMSDCIKHALSRGDP